MRFVITSKDRFPTSRPGTFRCPFPSGHPTAKPADIVGDLLAHTVGDVYDPFLGSGTTLIAAERLGRRCFGMEIAPEYCDVVVKRWEEFTGKKAKREKRGK